VLTRGVKCLENEKPIPPHTVMDGAWTLLPLLVVLPSSFLKQKEKKNKISCMFLEKKEEKQKINFD
jgi:hypothetical protein